MHDVAHARAKARKLLNEFGVRAPPVPIERIARSLGVKVEYAPFDDELSGMAFVKDGKSMIGINSLHHPNRQRFTLAHELAHIHLHSEQLAMAVHVDKGSLRRDLVSATGTDSNEIEANAFAAELLMPRELLSAFIEGKNFDFEDENLLAGLAKKFRVSLMALQLRLQSEAD
jgi:Zn-dependent peptidase ImmA (M78 family)